MGYRKRIAVGTRWHRGCDWALSDIWYVKFVTARSYL